MPYEPEYTKRFLRDLRRYASLRKQIKKQIERILEDPLVFLAFGPHSIYDEEPPI